MERRSAHSTVNAAYSIIQLNTVVAWEKELYVNVWTSPRKWDIVHAELDSEEKKLSTNFHQNCSKIQF